MGGNLAPGEVTRSLRKIVGKSRRLLIEGLVSVYGLANRLGVLDNRVARALFVRSYFVYKRRAGDPFAALTRRHPDVFRGGHILDVGANVGYTATVFAQALSPGFKVFAFEPERKNFDRLTPTLRRLGLSDRVEVFHAAVGASDGTAELWRNERHHGGHRITTDAFRSGRRVSTTDTVALVSIDQFVRDHGIDATVRFIKIDVEGYEPAVCEGMTAAIRANPRMCVALEYAPTAMRELGFEPDALIEFFLARDFVVHALGEYGAIEPFDAAHPERHLGVRGYVDLLCAKQRFAS